MWQCELKSSLSMKQTMLFCSCCTEPKFQGTKQNVWTAIHHCSISSKLPVSTKKCKSCQWQKKIKNWTLCNVCLLEALVGVHFWQEQVNASLPQHPEGCPCYQNFHFNNFHETEHTTVVLTCRLHKAVVEHSAASEYLATCFNRQLAYLLQQTAWLPVAKNNLVTRWKNYLLQKTTW